MSIEFSSVHALSEQLAQGQVTARQIVSVFLERIARHNPKLHAFVTDYRDEALSLADGADAQFAAGHRVSALQGIPIAIKDIIDMQGRVTTGGSRVWSDRVSPTTAPLVERLRDAGMIVLGKTHTVEFAMGGWGTNNAMGTPHNPWDLDVHRAPGGSSSGSGVAVGAGLAPCAIGTDTGGSVRLPASWNGLTGLKTTIGAVSCDGVLPLAHTLDTPGPLCRDAVDAELIFAALQGRTPTSSASRQDTVAGLRLATLSADEREQVDADVLAAYDEFVAQLQAAGAETAPLQMPMTVEQMGVDVGRIISAEGYSYVGYLTDDEAQPVDPDVRPRIAPGRTTSAFDYLKLLRERAAQTRAINTLMQDFDAWLTPGTCSPPPSIASIDQSTSPAVFTRPINYLDWCALVMPSGYTNTGLPLSVQVACPGNQEAMALRIGRVFQSTTDWHTRTPAGL